MPPIKIPQMQPWFDESESRAISEYLSSGAFLTEFEETERLEGELSEIVAAPFVTMLNSGTSALVAIASTLELQPGDEVIVPNYTMIATPNAFRLFGAKPVFVDVEPATLCLDLEATKAAISPRTRALVLVLANGREPTQGVSAFEALCQSQNITLIEDAAQALGSRYRDGRPMGSVGESGILSFSVPKIITTGQGGAVLTAQKSVNEAVRRFKDFGRTRGGVDIHDSFGLNLKFTDLQAVIGRVQLSKLQSRIALKKGIWLRYREGLEGISQVQMFDQDLDCTTPWFIDVLVEKREELIAHLSSRSIGARPMYPPINRQLTYSTTALAPVSDHVGANGLWLPSYSQLSFDEVDFICSQIRSFYVRAE